VPALPLAVRLLAVLLAVACSDDRSDGPRGEAGMAGTAGNAAGSTHTEDAGGGSAGRAGGAAGATGGAGGAAAGDGGGMPAAGEDGGGADADGGEPPDAGADAGEGGCAGEAPRCFVECGGDRLLDEPAQCTGDRWRCAQGVLPSDCPAGSCFGVPAFAERCVDGEWECHPDAETFETCPALACGTCRAFQGPGEQQGCRCECAANDTVTCAR
jgi:hypothetical protein